MWGWSLGVNKVGSGWSRSGVIEDAGMHSVSCVYLSISYLPVSVFVCISVGLSRYLCLCVCVCVLCVC